MMKTLSHFLPNEDALLAFASQMAKNAPKNAVIFLHGPLGAGKTTFSRGFLQGLGYNGKVKSPTYTLVEPYHLENNTLYHFDLYRLRDPAELEFIGIQDYVAEQAICLIEWPEQGGDWLPPADLSCYINFEQAGRMIKLVAYSKCGEEIVWPNI